MTEASVQALSVLRRVDNMQWYVVPFLVLVAYVYLVEIQKKNWGAVYLSIAMWGGEFIWEMFNASILRFTGRAPLWCTPGKSAFVIYVGLNIEIALFFAIAGLMTIKALPEDKNRKILGVSNRISLPIIFGFAAVFVEVLLNRSNLLIWEWPFWRWPHIYLIVVAYCSPLLLLAWCHDNISLKAKARWAVILPVLAIICHVVFATILGWV